LRHDSQTPPPATGAERILQAAIGLFGEQGVRATSLKAIAARAGVSAALVLHHYGSKDGLRVACDERVAELLRRSKTDVLSGGPHVDPLVVLASFDEHRPVLRYLARTLTDGSPHVNEMIDQMAADAEGYTAQAERSGLLKPSSDPRARVVVLLMWSLGALVLHDHVRRLLDVDLIDGPGPPLPYLHAALEIFSDGVLAEGAYDELRKATDVPTGATEQEPEER
jgi:AcrR family transcriptional regulator